jgi:2,3-dihydroxybenzoate-AMP ligase
MLEGCSPYPAEFAQRYVREGYWRAETMPQAIAAAAKTRPDAIAIVDERRKLTLRELIEEAAGVRALLENSGMRAGDRIVIQVPNCAEFASLLLACLDLGVIPVMALPAFRRAELEYLLRFSNARALAIAPQYRNFDHAALARELRAEVSGFELIFSTAPAQGCIALAPVAGLKGQIGASGADPFEVALFLLSGGTTGMPKLIPRTHTDYLYNARAAAEVCALDATSRILLALPAEHNFPLAAPGLLGAMLCGARAVFSQSTQAAELAATIEREAITHLPCVPTIAMALADLAPESRSMLRSLRVITVGGQKLQEPTARKLRRHYPWIIVQQVFGMAEGLICYTRLDDPDDVACTTQGRPMSPADELRIVDADGLDVREGELGELWCRGPYTIRGYYRAPERNAEAFTPDGFYRTGDLVRRGPGGNLIVEGRVKDLINRGGEKISAEEIEAHLLAHPAVMVAAVVSMPDAVLGEKACAYVKLRPGERLELAAMRTHLEARGVARFKWPERLEIVAEMPLTNVGKIKKAELRADIERKLECERSG